MKKLILIYITVCAVIAQTNCEWCGAQDAPKNLSWDIVINTDDDPGETLIMTGTIYQEDGKTPAKDIVVYVYHTNVEGVYPKRGNETDNARRHGYLRGWMKTNDKGQYRFKTIRPNAYKSRTEPAHIHYTISGPDYPEYWINATWFKGDELITERLKSKLNRQGGFSNIIDLKKDEKGIWRGNRDIILKRY